MNKILISFLLVFIIQSNIYSQSEYDIFQLENETIDFIKQPVNWDGDDWLKLGLISAGTFLVIQEDQSIRDLFQRNLNYKNSAPNEFGRIYGELYSPVIVAGAFGLHHLLSQDESSKKIAFEILQTTFYAGAITTALKLAFGRTRPGTADGSKSFGNWSLLDDSFHSFPSGHTTVAFSISTVLSKNAKTDFLKAIAYVPALLTAVSRVYQDDHWASDVIIGGIVGYTVGDWVTSKHNNIQLSFQAFSPRQFSLLIPLD
jgi:membrane-associated phospholipid phosphatase